MENISLPDPVLWFEGMPLLPHHFQQDFVYRQTLSHLQLQVSGGLNYGVLELEIDTLSLVKSILKVNKIFAVMPDGVVVKIENHPHYNLEYTLPKPEEFSKGNLGVYITIPKLVSNNYFVGKYPRYRKEEYLDVCDIYSGEDPVNILKMLPNINLHSDVDINTNYTSLKIANLSVDQNLWRVGDYVPATSKVTNNNQIYSICSEVVYSIRKKIAHLAQLLEVKSANSEVNYISENLLYAQGLAVGVPSLEGLLFSGQAHPFQLYMGLCHVLGGLALLTNKFAPPMPNTYNHDELLVTFQKMKIEIDGIINSVINENLAQSNFEFINNTYFINIKEEYIENKSLVIGFKKKNSCLEVDFLNWIKNTIMCDAGKIDITVQNRTLGFSRMNVEKTEDVIPKKGVYLVKILLENVKEDLNKLAILNYDNQEHAPEEISVFYKNKGNV